MKKLILPVFALLLIGSLASCGSKKETAASIAQKWCDLNGKVAKAEGPAKEAAKEALGKYENEMEAKYGKDEKFMNEIENESEKCEAASEGR